MAKGGSKVLTAVIAFLLGFIFAILVEVGAVFGVYYYVTRTDLDNIFQTLGIENKDEEGNYIYVNTDNAQNLGELFKQLKGYLYSDGSSEMDYPVLGKSLDDISNLIPITQRLLAEKLYPKVTEFVDINWEDFESTAISDLPQFLSDSVMDIRPAKMLGKLGMDGLVGEDANIVVKALLEGVEFDYAYTPSGLKFPVYYDDYTYNEELSSYHRVKSQDNTDAYPSHLSEDLLYKTGTVLKSEEGGEQEEGVSLQSENEKQIYRLYYIPCSVNNGLFGDAELAEEGDTVYVEGTAFYAVKRIENKKEYVLNLTDEFLYLPEYGLHNMDRTGNFYYTNEDAELQLYPVTIRSFSSTEEVFKPLYSIPVTELLGGGEDNIIEDVFGSLSVGELIDGKADLDEMINNLELATVININPDQSLMAYIGYGITNIKKADDNAGWQYEGFVDVDGVSTLCYITSEYKGEQQQKNIDRVWYYDKDGALVDVKGTTVKEVANLANDLELPSLLNIKADDAILGYLGYGLSGVSAQKGDGYTHVGKAEIYGEKFSCYISTNDEGYITDVWRFDETGARIKVSGTKIDGLSDRMNGLSDNLSLPDVLDIKAEQSITSYIGYGISGIKQESGDGYSHTGVYKTENGTETTCYIATDDDGKITSAWYFDEGNKRTVQGTTLSQLPDRIDNIANDLTLKDVMDINEDDTILWSLKDSKISELGTEVKKLKVGDILDAEDIRKSAILKQLKNKSIDDLSTAIDAIAIQSIYTKEVYGFATEDDVVCTLVSEYNSKILYLTKEGEGEDAVYTYVHSEYSEDKDKEDLVGRLTEEEFNEGIASGVEYYTYGEAQGMWRLILFKEDKEKVYTLNNFNNMVKECTGNIYNAKLSTLQEAKIIDENKDLSKTLVWYSKNEDNTYTRHDDETLGDITLRRLIDIVLNMEFPDLPLH